MKKHNISIDELKKTIDVFQRAIEDHTNWLMGWHRAIICESCSDEIGQYLRDDAHHHCKFGHWYYDSTQSYLADSEAFAAIEAVHKTMHDTGRELLLVSMKGDKISSTDYDTFLGLRETLRGLLRTLDADLHGTLLETDPLTRVPNRHNIVPFLSDRRTLLENYQEESTVCMLDIDHFKKVNDTYGHPAGDQVLATVANVIASHLRNGDRIFRYGGEEFLLTFAASGLISSCRVADKLRALLANQTIIVADNTSLQVTASFGLASLRPRVDINEIIACADKALYSAKEHGRNQVCCTIPNGAGCVTKPWNEISAGLAKAAS